MTKTISISDEVYAKLNELKGKLMIKAKKPISLSDTIKHVLNHYQEPLYTVPGGPELKIKKKES